MERVILIKYGELTTKKGNRNFFVRTLYENIKHKLKDCHVTISKDISRMYIEFEEQELSKVLDGINHVFGIHMYHVAYKIPTDLETMKEEIVKILKKEKFKTFKVETKRSDKNFPVKALEMNPLLGSHILKNIKDIKVDVHNPDILVRLEIRENYSYFYIQDYYGLGGYPVGTQPRGMLMLSGGIDSPVAGFLALKRGIKIEAVYFEALPHTSLEARNKVMELSKKLVNYTDEIKLHVVPFTKIQETIYKEVPSNYCITIMRRMMYRIMEQLAKKRKAFAIINGESIGQVASQTLTSMYVINQVTNMPVIRPVACLDKLEIIDIAKKIDTYDISILPYEDCCTIFVPKHPVINPNIEECLKFEKKFNFEKLIEETVDQTQVISITDQKTCDYQELL